MSENVLKSPETSSSQRNAVASRLKAERVQELLRLLPRWRLTRDQALTCRFHFPGRMSAAAFAAMVSSVILETGHPLDLTLRGTVVVCKIASATAEGLTLSDLDLAQLIGQTL